MPINGKKLQPKWQKEQLVGEEPKKTPLDFSHHHHHHSASFVSPSIYILRAGLHYGGEAKASGRSSYMRQMVDVPEKN